MNRIAHLAFLIWLGSSVDLAAQSQPAGIVLDGSGVSRIYPPFDSSGWSLTRHAGDGTHQGDDFFAQDWAKDCFSEGSKLYAGISGSIQLNPLGDGIQESYGNTVLIVDHVTGFALRYAHLQEFNPSFRNGDLVLAGMSIGRVGFTGNVFPSSGCMGQGGRGAHAHIVLYKEVSRLNGRPLTINVNSGGPTIHSANFLYAPHVRFGKSPDSPTVFVLQNGFRVPVTPSAYANNGMDFDRSKSVFNPFAGIEMWTSELQKSLLAGWFWPTRNGSLVKSESDPTVYLIQDGRKKGLTSSEFNCRGFKFSEVVTVPGREAENYPVVNQGNIARGCKDEVLQALTDMVKLINLDRRFQTAQLGSYGVDFEWNSGWELRFMTFFFSGTRQVTVNHVTSVSNPSERFIMYWDPDSSTWNGWHRMY